MDCYVGIDLGSTTTKAIYMDTEERILGRGITNSRSNYELACEIARDEAAINARFALLRARIAEGKRARAVMAELMGWLESKFHLAHHLEQVKALEELSEGIVKRWPDAGERALYREALLEIFARMREAAPPLFRPDAPVRSDFFRDIASSQYLEFTENLTREPDDERLTFDRLTAVYDRAILLVEGRNYSTNYGDYLEFDWTDPQGRSRGM